MADLTSNFVGIKSPNPFWLASAPPTDKEYNVRRAFEAGWGGVVWKTLGSEGPPVVNVNGPRYGVIHGSDRRVLGLNNIELITDRDLYKNLEEIKRVKQDYPDRAIVVSLMVPCEEEAWKAILPLVEETPCREEITELNEFYKNNDVQLIGLAIDEMIDVIKFQNEVPINYPSYVANDIEGVTLAKNLGNARGILPFTVIVQPNGLINKTFYGKVNIDDLNQALSDKSL